MGYEYKYIEQIQNVERTESGLQGKMDHARAEAIIKEWTDKGWRVHTVFPDPYATTLIERNSEESVMMVLLKQIQEKKRWFQ